MRDSSSPGLSMCSISSVLIAWGVATFGRPVIDDAGWCRWWGIRAEGETGVEGVDARKRWNAEAARQCGSKAQTPQNTTTPERAELIACLRLAPPWAPSCHLHPASSWPSEGRRNTAACEPLELPACPLQPIGHRARRPTGTQRVGSADPVGSARRGREDGNHWRPNICSGTDQGERKPACN